MNKLIKALPIISIVLVVLSFLNLHLYYRNFGIDIQNYLDLSEIIFSLTVFLPGVGMFVVFALIMLIALTPEHGVKEQQKPSDNKLYKYFKDHRSKRLRILARFSSNIFFAALVVSAVVIALILLRPYIFPEEDILQATERFDFYLFIIVMTSSFAATVIAASIKGIDIESETAFYFLIGAIFITSLGALSYRGFSRSDLILTGKPKYEVEFKTLNSTYVSDDSTHYVGSTRNFHFLYHVGREENTVIPVKDVIEAKFKKLRTGL
jgi:hypothetical protein